MLRLQLNHRGQVVLDESADCARWRTVPHNMIPLCRRTLLIRKAGRHSPATQARPTQADAVPTSCRQPTQQQPPPGLLPFVVPRQTPDMRHASTHVLSCLLDVLQWRLRRCGHETHMHMTGWALLDA
mmetsp:Transcript_17521/g.44126  ORF Transcript_17521/g.44126 Transcript_17521/m.44126 type:complete len:127 (+) Transcript_17521:614-994(+)